MTSNCKTCGVLLYPASDISDFCSVRCENKSLIQSLPDKVRQFKIRENDYKTWNNRNIRSIMNNIICLYVLVIGLILVLIIF